MFIEHNKNSISVKRESVINSQFFKDMVMKTWLLIPSIVYEYKTG